MDTWRDWILEGRLADARNGLKRHLVARPDSKDAWSLLADCERKSNRWRQSVDAYRRVMDLAPRAERRRAAFRAASILQDRQGDHRQAVQLLEEYIRSSSNGGMMRAEAMVRLARSYIAIGKRGQAVELLKKVTDNHIGTMAALKAREMLRTLKKSESVEQ